MTNKPLDHIEAVKPVLWEAWRSWMYGLGCRLGPDNPSAKLSPHLTDSYDMLTPESKAYFHQWAALTLWALDKVAPATAPPAKKPSRFPKVAKRLRRVGKAVEAKDFETAHDHLTALLLFAEKQLPDRYTPSLYPPKTLTAKVATPAEIEALPPGDVHDVIMNMGVKPAKKKPKKKAKRKTAAPVSAPAPTQQP